MMKFTIHDQKLLSTCCEALITYIKEKESTFQEYLIHMKTTALNRDQAIDALQAALRIQQIYFRVLHIIKYIENHPHEFRGEQASWIKEANRITNIYKAAESKYLNTLSDHATVILEAYNVMHETPPTFAADFKMKEVAEAAQSKPTKKPSVISASTELEHKQFKIKTLVGILRNVVENGDYQVTASIASDGASKPTGKTVAVAQLHAAHLQIESFILEGRNIDRSLVSDLDVHAQMQYRMLCNQHEPIKIWLDILTEATTASQKSMRLIFNRIKVKQQLIEHAERGAVKIVVGAFCGPAAGAVDPVFNVFRALSESVLSGKGLSSVLTNHGQDTSQTNIREQLGAFIHWVLKSDEKSDPISALVKTLESNPPNTTLEWMKKYMEYKISGPKVFAEMFQKDTAVWQPDEAGSQLEGNIDPIHIIKAKRRELMKQYKLETKDGLWEKHFSKNEYKKLFSKVKNDLSEHFTTTVNDIFAAYAEQYKTAEGLRNIVNHIKKKTFDDNKAGLASFDRANYEEIIDTIANVLTLAGLLRFAMTYEPYWGGSAYPSDEHIRAIQEGTFSPEMNGKIGIARTWKTDILNKAIYECYIKTQVGSANKLHHPFSDFDRVDDTRCEYFKTRYTPQQNARYTKILEIMHEYFFTPIDTRLIKSIESQVQKPNSNDPTTLSPPVTAIDKIHGWKSAESLYTESKARLNPYIKILQADKTAVKQENEYAKTCLYSKINLLRRTKLNKDIEAAKNRAASPSSPSKLMFNAQFKQ